MGWKSKAAMKALKIGGKGAARVVFLPLALGLDVLEIGVDAYTGNLFGAGLGIVLLVADVATLGQAGVAVETVGIAKEMLKEGAEAATVEIAKEVACKEAAKKAVFELTHAIDPSLLKDIWGGVKALF